MVVRKRGRPVGRKDTQPRKRRARNQRETNNNEQSSAQARVGGREDAGRRTEVVERAEVRRGGGGGGGGSCEGGSQYGGSQEDETDAQGDDSEDEFFSADDNFYSADNEFDTFFDRHTSLPPLTENDEVTTPNGEMEVGVVEVGAAKAAEVRLSSRQQPSLHTTSIETDLLRSRYSRLANARQRRYSKLQQHSVTLRRS